MYLDNTKLEDTPGSVLISLACFAIQKIANLHNKYLLYICIYIMMTLL